MAPLSPRDITSCHVELFTFSRQCSQHCLFIFSFFFVGPGSILGPRVTPISDLVWTSTWVSKPWLFSCAWVNLRVTSGATPAFFQQKGCTLYKYVYSRLVFRTSLTLAEEGRPQWDILNYLIIRVNIKIFKQLLMSINKSSQSIVWHYDKI